LVAPGGGSGCVEIVHQPVNSVGRCGGTGSQLFRFRRQKRIQLAKPPPEQTRDRPTASYGDRRITQSRRNSRMVLGRPASAPPTDSCACTAQNSPTFPNQTS